MTDTSAPPMDYEEHTKTFSRFVRFSTAATIACIYICVALVGYGIGNGAMSYLIATIGMLVGFGCCVYGAASEQNSWLPSAVVLVLMGLATVMFL